MSDKYVVVINKDFKGKIISKRKDFMDLLLKALGDNEEVSDDLRDKFGTRIVEKYHGGNKVTFLNDGEIVFKE